MNDPFGPIDWGRFGHGEVAGLPYPVPDASGDLSHLLVLSVIGSVLRLAVMEPPMIHYQRGCQMQQPHDVIQPDANRP